MAKEGGDPKGKMVDFFKRILEGKIPLMPANLHAEMVLETLGCNLFTNLAIKNPRDPLLKLCEVRPLTFSVASSTDFCTPSGHCPQLEAYFSVKALLSCLLGVFRYLGGGNNCLQTCAARQACDSLSSSTADLSSSKHCCKND
jgi:hypothetical protein